MEPTFTIEAIQAKIAEAWKEAWNCYHALAVYQAGRINRDFSDFEKEEIANSTLDELFESIDQCKSVQHITRLAYTIAYNRSIDQRRKHYAVKNGGGKIEGLGEEIVELTDTGLSPHEALVLEEWSQAVAECIKKLPKKYAAIFEALTEEGLGSEEIARRFSLTPNSVKSYLYQGRLLLKDCLNTSETK